MKSVKWILAIVFACSVWSCGPAADDSAGNAKELSKEMPKSDPNVKADPSPLEGYTPKAGVPGGAPKK